MTPAKPKPKMPKSKGRKDAGADAPKGKGPRPRRKSKAARKDDEGDGTCGVPKCTNEAARSISFKKAKAAMGSWDLDKGPRRLHVCKDHYKEFKKATRTDRELDKAGWTERSGRYDGGR